MAFFKDGAFLRVINLSAMENDDIIELPPEEYMAMGHDHPKMIASGWGWENPPTEILEMAGHVRDAKSKKSGNLIALRAGIKQERIEELIRTKPSQRKTLDWIAQQEPEARTFVEEIIALKAGYPFYRNLGLLTMHPAMEKSDVAKRAEELEAALMLVESSKPCLVFSTYDSLIRYSTQGRNAKASDPFHIVIDSAPLLMAVADRRDLLILLGQMQRELGQSNASEAADVIWHANSADTPEQREFARLVDFALSHRATDIALVPFRNGGFYCRMRRYGDLQVPSYLPDGKIDPGRSKSLLNFMLQRSGANPESTMLREPRDGQMTYRSTVGEAYLRMSFIPLNHIGDLSGRCSVSIRLLPRQEQSVGFEELGLQPKTIEALSFASSMPSGVMLLVGGTNTGKSSTIAGSLNMHCSIFGDTKKRISVEDPIERFLYGVDQINVPTRRRDSGEKDRRAEEILRAIKRHDPDVIFVGEIRDRETLDLSIQSATSGHLVFSTYHGSDAMLGYEALVKSVSPDQRIQFVESMVVIIAQRLVKKLCSCRVEHTFTKAEQDYFRRWVEYLGETGTLPNSAFAANPKGCQICSPEGEGGVNVGFDGMVPINEILPFSRVTRNIALDLLDSTHGVAKGRDTLRLQRSMTFLQSGLDRLAAGEIDLKGLFE